MNAKKWKPYILFILLTEAVGGLAGWLTRDGVRAFDSVTKSDLTPPNAVFPIVWTILFALMGTGAAGVYLSPKAPVRTRALFIFAVQLMVNFFWSLYFFNLQAYGFSFLWLVLLLALIVVMTYLFAKSDKPAALIQAPYLIWVTFAGYLNFVVWYLNRA